MKKFLLSLAVLFTATFSANAQIVDTKPICGTYTCDFYLSMPDPIPDDLEPFPGTPVQILPGDEAGTINFFLQNFTMGTEVLGDVLLKNIKVQCDAEGKYTFVEHDAQRVELADGEIVADAKLNCATTYVKNGKLYADVDIVWIMNDVPDLRASHQHRLHCRHRRSEREPHHPQRRLYLGRSLPRQRTQGKRSQGCLCRERQENLEIIIT